MQLTMMKFKLMLCSTELPSWSVVMGHSRARSKDRSDGLGLTDFPVGQLADLSSQLLYLTDKDG